MTNIEVEIVIRTKHANGRFAVERRWSAEKFVTDATEYHADYEQLTLLKLVERVHEQLDLQVVYRNTPGTGYTPKLNGREAPDSAQGRDR